MEKRKIESGAIDRYNDDLMSPEEREVFNGMMERDVLLRTEVTLDKHLTRFLADSDTLEMMTKIRTVMDRNKALPVNLKVFLAAASVVSFIAMAGLFYLVMNSSRAKVAEQNLRHDSVHEVVHWAGNVSGHSGPKVEDHLIAANGLRAIGGVGLLASAFDVLPEFEVLVGAVTRSAPVTVTQPAVAVTIAPGTPVSFEWKGNGNPVIIRFYNNLGSLVASCIPHSSGHYTFPTSGMTEGLYYWKVLSGEELLITGKVIIKNHR